MPVSFTPQFFTRSTSSASTPVKASMKQSMTRDLEQKKYSTQHGVPKQQGGVATFSTKHERYADIDWNKKQVITQDGAHIKFGASLGDPGETVEKKVA